MQTEILPTVGGITGINKTGDTPGAVEPVHIFSAGNTHHTPASNGARMLNTQTLVSITAHR
jgi:hypothetical protein